MLDAADRTRLQNRVAGCAFPAEPARWVEALNLDVRRGSSWHNAARTEHKKKRAEGDSFRLNQAKQ
jgi:hypothetical protein